jgi:hypothetical protein
MAKRSRRKRKYSPSAGREVKNEMHRYKRGKAKSGPGGKGGRVKSRKQAIAIALSKARKKGKKVPRKKEVEPRECRCPAWAMTGIRVAAEMSRAR